MPNIHEMLLGMDDQIDYETILGQTHPWIAQPNMKCIISPDSDGLLSGLLMSYLYDWKIVGYYDGKVMLIKSGVNCADSDVVFLDMDVCRKGIKSIGHHMLIYNWRNIPPGVLDGYSNCLQPNLLRKYDALHRFRLKYPIATVHLLLGLLGYKGHKFDINERAICPLLFVDGTFLVLFGYPENVINWLGYLRFDEPYNPLKDIFANDHYTVYRQMLAMDAFYRRRNEISISNERGDRLRISLKSGEPHNIIVNSQNTYDLDSSAVERVRAFIGILQEFTGWEFRSGNWNFDGFDLKIFSKSDFKGEGWRMNRENFERMISRNPFSWAITSGDNIEFTVEK